MIPAIGCVRRRAINHLLVERAQAPDRQVPSPLTSGFPDHVLEDPCMTLTPRRLPGWLLTHGRRRAGRVRGAALLAVLGTIGCAGSANAAPSPTPPVTEGLQLWWEASTTTGTDGAEVSTWPDRSGLNRTLTANGTAASPVMRSGCGQRA